KAADWLRKLKPNIRKFYGQNYVQALVNGDIWIAGAYSGDIFQSNLSGNNLQYVNPDEGGLLWVDNLVLLANSKHPVDAMELMNWYYKPNIAAMVAEYVGYITPVPDAQKVVEADAK